MYYSSINLQMLKGSSFLNQQITNIIQKRNRSFVKWYRSLWAPKKMIPPYKHVAQIGDPVLRNVARPVPLDQIKSKETESVIATIKQVMNKYNSMGLAASQIGVPLRIFAIEFNKKRLDEFPRDVYKSRDMETVPLTIFINPEMKITNYEKVVLQEACESFRGYCADVPRYRSVSISAFNSNGEPFKMQAKGWTARIIQHEMDHLDGKFYTDIMHRNTLACGCWEAVNSHAGRIEIRFVP